MSCEVCSQVFALQGNFEFYLLVWLLHWTNNLERNGDLCFIEYDSVWITMGGVR